MSRERYRRPRSPPPVERWDTERFAMERERDRSRFAERDRFEERDHFEERESRPTRGGLAMRPRERSVDEIYERRGPRGFEEDEYRKRVYYDEPEERIPPRFAREPRRESGERTTIRIEKERIASPSPPPRRPLKPVLVRRQSSLDTFDRKPFSPPWREREREEYGPPARREDFRRDREEYRPPAYVPIPLPRTRALVPSRRYEREIEVAEPDYYGDEAYRPYPERVREREIIRRRRRSPSAETHSARASSIASSVSSSSISEAPASEFPKRGKTRMPARLVSKKAIIELGYPFEEEEDTIVIMKALGPENIDEVIKLSEEYKSETKTVYRIEGAEMSGGRSSAGEIIEERTTTTTQEIVEVPAPPPPPPAPVPEIVEEVVKTTTIERRDVSPARSHQSHHHHHRHESEPLIVHANSTRHESDFVETRKEKQVEIRSGPITVGALALVPNDRQRDARAISAEIRALEAEKEALKMERRAHRESRRARREGRESGELVLYEERIDRVAEPSGGVRIERDRKEESRAKAIRTMLKTLT